MRYAKPAAECPSVETFGGLAGFVVALLMMLTLCWVVPAAAGPGGGQREPDPAPIVSNLQQSLDLTADQAEKLREGIEQDMAVTDDGHRRFTANRSHPEGFHP